MKYQSTQIEESTNKDLRQKTSVTNKHNISRDLQIMVRKVSLFCFSFWLKFVFLLKKNAEVQTNFGNLIDSKDQNDFQIWNKKRKVER
jgi:hypothetical protein